MHKVWDGTEWSSAKALKVWNGTQWKAGLKFKVRTSTSWLPGSISDKDDSQIIKWSVEAPTPPPPPPPVTHPVPDLDLKTLLEVDALLSPLAFDYTVTDYVVTADNTRDDKVVIDSQNPPAGELLAEGSTVTIKLYNFVQPTTIVPNLDNLLVSAANTAITNANLVVSTNIGTDETYDTNLIGRVINGSQYPTAGDEVDTQTEVTYDKWIQKPYSTVPNIVGLNDYDVFTTLDAATLNIGNRTVVATSVAANDDKVKSQYPAQGTQVQQDSNVDYEVWEYSLRVVPNLNGLTQEQASDAIYNAGLYVGTISNQETTVVSDEGKVKSNSQSHPAGSEVNAGTSINFTVWVPNTTSTVPTVVGLFGLANIQTAIRNVELIESLRTVTYTRDSSLFNKCYAQSPNPGTTVNVNSTVYVDMYLQEPTYTVPSILGLTPSSGAINSNFTWGSNTLASTSTQTTTNFGKVATQSPTSGTSSYAGSINYGIYVDGRPTVPNVVGQTEATAKTNINNAGLNWSVTYQNQTYSGQATAGTVASQSPASGTRLASGGTVSIVVWNAYTAQPVTRSAIVYFGDDSVNGHYYNGTMYTTASSLVDWNWQAGYKLMATTGTRTGTAGYQTTTWDVGTNPSATSNGKNGCAFRFSKSGVTSYISNYVTSQPITINSLTLKIDTGSVGDDGTTWWIGYYTGSNSSAPTTMTDSNTNNLISFTKYTSWTHSIGLSGDAYTQLYTNEKPLTIHQGVNSSSTSRWGRVNKVWYEMSISWTEYV